MRKIFVLIILLTAIYFQSCSTADPDSISVVSELPEGIIANNSSIKVVFSKAVVSIDSVNKWSPAPYIEFTPAISGAFIWQDSSTLVFSPDAPLPGDTKYEAKINSGLITDVSGAASFEGDNEFEFATESFKMRGAEFFYDKAQNSKEIELNINLEFNYDVDPNDVEKHLKLYIDDKQIKPEDIPSDDKSRVIPVKAGSISKADKDRKIRIEFADGFRSVETKTIINMEEPFTAALPRTDALTIYGHDFSYLENESWIKIRTSQEADLNSAKSHISIEPNINYKVESDRDGILIKGNFTGGASYKLTLKEGLESILGGELRSDYETDILFGDIAPGFRFASDNGVYMLLGGEKKILVKTVNLPKLKVTISQIFQNNLTYFLENGRYYDWDYYYDDASGESSYKRKYRYYVGNYGRQLETKTVNISGQANKETDTYIDIAPYMNNGYKGFYLVEIANPEESWRATSKLISISNIGLIVKKGESEASVFAVSLETNDPLKDVTINLISSNNQLLSSQKTDGEGIAKFENLGSVLKDFSLKIITAEKDDDFNFINLDDYRVETSRFDVGGKRDYSSMDAYLFGDRNLYRPGEKVIISGIVRNFSGSVKDIPVVLKIINPSGRTVSETRYNLNDEGGFESSYQTLQSDQTGVYRFELYTGNKIFLSSYNVSIEEFSPDRLRVNLTSSTDKASLGEKVNFELSASNFFGPPAAGRNWEFEGTFQSIPFKSEKYQDYSFKDDNTKENLIDPIILSGKTDEEGKAYIETAIPQELTSYGMLRFRGKAAVFDESGRPVYQLSQVKVYPKNYFIGILNPGRYYIQPNSSQKIKIAVVDKNDNPINGFKAKVELIRKEWRSVLRKHNESNSLRYISELKEITERADVIEIKGEPYEYTYSVQRSGDYVLRVSKEGDGGYNQISFYAYSWATSDITSFAVDPEAKVEIVMDKKTYSPGEKAKLLFQTPFDGKMLVTIERNNIYEHRYIDVKKNSASIEVPVKEEYLPNVYVSAVLFRKVKEMDLPLMAGHGFAPLMTENKNNKLNVQINVPAKIKPRQKQKITVKAEPGSTIAIAAVDEGILQIKNYKTPDPYGYFYARKALATETFDFFRDLLPEPVKRSAKSVGGDADLEGQYRKRVNPLGTQRFRPLAFWSGLLKVNSDGTAETVIDIPEFNGEIRVMAIVYKGNKFGFDEKPMTVADPIVITPALPRFLSADDSIIMPITAFNTTDKGTNLKFEISVEGGIKADQKTAELYVGANEEKYTEVGIHALNKIGKAVVKVKTSAFGETIESSTELPVRSISPLVSESNVGFVDAGKKIDFKIDDNYMSFGRKAYVSVSPFPVANFAKELKQLIGYPHGCLEQTVSKAFPQIYLRDIAQALDPSITSHGSPAYFVNEAIYKISSMQRYDGYFSYWPGDEYVNEWTTVYAAHFLLEAKNAGFGINEKVLSLALDAIAKIARNKKTQVYYYYENNKTVAKELANKSAVYALYVLAAAKRPETSVMNYYRVERSLLTQDLKYLLAGAFALSGDRRTYLEILPKQYVEENPARNSFDFDSPIRSKSIILNVLLETDLNSSSIPVYMNYLSNIYKANTWHSTQDDAFTLLAFGKAARMASAAKLSGEIKVGGKEYKYTGGTQKFEIDPFGKTVTIDLSGSGRAYYSLVTEGIRTDGKVKIADQNLSVRREFYNRNGQRIDLNSIRQNDLVIIKLIVDPQGNFIENIAVTDMLPAGFEVENPRLSESSQYSFMTNANHPNYVDFRDDRVNIYVNLNRSAQVFYYAVRAVSRGEFVYAPVVAEAMYNPDFYSASGGGKLIVSK